LSRSASAAATIMPRPIIVACFTEIFVITNFHANLSYTVNGKIRAARAAIGEIVSGK
jgi:hypothetical protein